MLSGQIPWRRLFLAGLATALCCTGLGVYIAYVASSSLVSNEAMYGPFGAVMTLVTAEIGLGVALQLGAVIGAAAAVRASPPTTPVTWATLRPRARMIVGQKRRAERKTTHDHGKGARRQRKASHDHDPPGRRELRAALSRPRRRSSRGAQR
jgi:uncharacterized BrkB/YihY/UPF0761 family membrane protein